MARPKKEAHEQRVERFGNPRYTIKEKADAAQSARTVGLDPSEFVRRRVLGYAVPPARTSADAMLLTELNRIGFELRVIGNNVNQLARSMNSGRRLPVDWTLIYDRLQETVIDIELSLGKLSLSDDP